MKNQLVITLACLLLSGCAATSPAEQQRIDKLSADVSALKLKAERLQQDLNTLRPEAQKAKAEANRANYRLNIRGYLDCLCEY